MEPSVVRHKKSYFNSAKNGAASSLWVGGHQFGSYILVVSNCFVNLNKSYGRVGPHFDLYYFSTTVV